MHVGGDGLTRWLTLMKSDGKPSHSKGRYFAFSTTLVVAIK